MRQTRNASVAANIRAEMKRQRIRQPVIAAALGLSQASVSRKLTGHTPLTVDELAVVADVLGVDLVELVKAA